MSFTFERTTQEMEESVGDDGRVIRVYTLGYLSKSFVSSPDPSVLDVKQGLGLQAGGGFLDDANATLRKIHIGRRKTLPPHCAWDITLTYSTAATNPANDSDDPTQTRVKRYKKYREVSRYIVQDRLQKMILNAAGQPFSGGIPVTDYPAIYIYEWYRASPTKGFHKTINQNTFNGCDPKTLLCLIDSEEEYQGSFYFWKERIEMHYDPLGWPQPQLNAGLMQINPLNPMGELVNCVDAHFQQATQPEPLYGEDVPGGTFKQKKGMQVLESDRPDKCSFIKPDYFAQTQFEKIGVQQFP